LPQIFLSNVAKLNEDRFTKYYCNKCAKGYPGSPQLAMKIIMITAYEVDSDMIRQLKDNEFIIDIVQKPIAIDSLMAKVAQGIEN
jgi:hypothetical protein